MDSIILLFKASKDLDKKGTLLYRIVYNGKTRQIDTGFRIYPHEWSEDQNTLVLPSNDNRDYNNLISIRNDLEWEMKRFVLMAEYFKKNQNCIDDLVKAFQGSTVEGKGVFEFMRRLSEKHSQLGRTRCGETMESTLRSFIVYRNGVDLSFPKMTTEVVERYEAFLKSRGVTRNTSSFYMRNLRSAYKLAVKEGLTADRLPFHSVYTGIDKTKKRAISISDIRKIKTVDLSRRPAHEFARDMLMFSFYTRGMSFIDMAYLCKKDVADGYITYRRKKTGQELSIAFVPEMEAILDKYQSSTQYLLPIITSENGAERQQYRNQLIRINRHLKKIGKMLGISIPLSTYVMRHSWATIARNKGISLSIISEGLGHDSETTTRVYLDSIQKSKVDKANRLILDDI